MFMSMIYTVYHIVTNESECIVSFVFISSKKKKQLHGLPFSKYIFLTIGLKDLVY